MRRKICAAAVFVALMSALAVSAAFAAEDDSSFAPSKSEEKVNLTEAQKSELKKLYEQKFQLEKQIIQKYVDFGVMPKDMADKKLEKIEQMKKKLEENGYAPLRHKGFKGKKGERPDSGEGQTKQDT